MLKHTVITALVGLGLCGSLASAQTQAQPRRLMIRT